LENFTLNLSETTGLQLQVDNEIVAYGNFYYMGSEYSNRFNAPENEVLRLRLTLFEVIIEHPKGSINRRFQARSEANVTFDPALTR
jgi:hypothetical protein